MMKKILLSIVIILILASCSKPAINFEYELNEDTNEITITGYKSDTKISEFDNVKIPADIDGYPVVGIKDMAFLNLYIESVEIPDSVWVIGEKAFAYCVKLYKVTLSNNLSSISNGMFMGCALRSITIPESVTTIGNLAFSYCSELKNINIPESVISIGKSAFYGCYSLSDEVKEHILQINPEAFDDPEI